MKFKDFGPRALALPQLGFDTSGTAVARFFGEIAEVEVHWQPDDEVPKYRQTRLVCPRSLDPQARCSGCEDGRRASPRQVLTCWDVRAGRWAVFMTSRRVVDDLIGRLGKMLLTPAEMAGGEGPDVLIQRIGMVTEVEPMRETLGEKRGDGKIPPGMAVVKGLKRALIYKHDLSRSVATGELPAPPPDALLCSGVSLNVPFPGGDIPSPGLSPNPKLDGDDDGGTDVEYPDDKVVRGRWDLL